MTKESGKSIAERLTVVIPCKNEGMGLWTCLYGLSKQEGINGTRVIIADSSDNAHSLDVLKRLRNCFKSSLTVETIEGGYPAKARLEGSKLVTTELVLFLDADTMLTGKTVIKETITEIDKNRDLVTTSMITDLPYNIVYQAFYLSQLLCQYILKSPFAPGGFQLWRAEAYWKVGGYDPEELFAEDYSLSRKVDPKRFKVMKTNSVYTSSRRFKKTGVTWMVRIMLKSYIYRNDPQFFRSHHGYWD